MSGIDGIIFDPVQAALKKAAIEASQRQAIYSYNIANASTPGFKPKHFEDELDLAERKLKLKEEFNLEEEMAKMNENRLFQSAVLKILSTRGAVKHRIMLMGKG